MAMVKCPECESNISEYADQCPVCGYPIKKSTQTIKGNQEGNHASVSTYVDKPSEKNSVSYRRDAVYKDNKSNKAGMIIIAVVLLICAVAFLLNQGKKYAEESISNDVTSNNTANVVEPIASTKSADNSNTNSKSSKSDSLEADATKTNDIKYEITDIGFEYYEDSIGSIEYYGFVEVLNTGTSNIYLDDCIFDLEDDSGKLLSSEDWISKCPDIIGPGEKGYFYNGIGGNFLDDGVSTSNGLNMIPNYKLTKATGDYVDYDISDIDIKNGSYGVTVTGRVENNTDEDDGLLYLNVIFYGQDGKVLGITGTNITDLDAGRKVSFECSTIGASKNITMDAIADYKIIARKDYYQW